MGVCGVSLTLSSVPFQGQRWVQSALRETTGAGHVGSVPYGGVSQYGSASQHPLVKINVAPASEDHASTEHEAVDAKPAATEPAIAHGGTSPVDSANASEQE